MLTETCPSPPYQSGLWQASTVTWPSVVHSNFPKSSQHICIFLHIRLHLACREKQKNTLFWTHFLVSTSRSECYPLSFTWYSPSSVTDGVQDVRRSSGSRRGAAMRTYIQYIIHTSVDASLHSCLLYIMKEHQLLLVGEQHVVCFVSQKARTFISIIT